MHSLSEKEMEMDNLRDQGVDVRIILNCTTMTKDQRNWTGFISIRIRYSDGFF